MVDFCKSKKSFNGRHNKFSDRFYSREGMRLITGAARQIKDFPAFLIFGLTGLFPQAKPSESEFSDSPS